MRVETHEDRDSLKNRVKSSACSHGYVKSMDNLLFDYDLSGERRTQIISAYLDVVETMSEPLASESMLPYPKELIERAIFLELNENPECDLRNDLEIAYVQLESFIPPDEYGVMREFKKTSMMAEMADMANPVSVIRSARILRKAKGADAVGIQEKISRNMRERCEQIEVLRKTGLRRKPSLERRLCC